MTCLQTAAMKEPLVDMVEPNMIISNECCILDLDLVNCDKDDVEFCNSYSLTFNSNDKVHALVSWFDCHFSDLKNPVTLSTSPYKAYTHWKNVVFYMDHELRAYNGDELKGSIAVRKSKNNFREQDIKISYHFNNGESRTDYTQMYKIR